MKKITIYLAAAALLVAMSAPAMAKTGGRDGSFGIQIGYYNHGSRSVAVAGATIGSINFDGDFIVKADYEWYQCQGATAWNVSVFYTNPDVNRNSLGTTITGDAKIWQLGVNHKWFVDSYKEGAGKGVYIGVGMGWASMDVDLRNIITGATASSDDSSLDFNLLIGIQGRGGSQVELLWIMDEGAFGATAGYRF